MLELRQSYHTLLRSPAQLAFCRQAQSVADLLAALRTLWGAAEASDNALLQAIDALNRETLPDDVAADMAGIWLPRLYRVRSQRLQWCLPDGPATEPFHDEYLIRCWQSTTLNQLITPTTSVQSLAACAGRVPGAQPAGFIFHLSRCGSTLLSGCLSELDDAVVFSESPVLTEVLVDPALSPRDKRAHVQCLIDLKASLFPGRRVVIKWNAWDIFQWALLRGLYPAVPVVVLVRDPMEILASHHAIAGRHMSGDPSLACVAPVFSASRGATVLDHRIGVLEGLLQAMGALEESPALARIDYSQLHGETIRHVASMFGLRFSAEGRLRMEQRMQSNAKLPGTRFEPDRARKAGVFSADEGQIIEQRLSALHQTLVPRPEQRTPPFEVAHAL
ncbi:MAG: sulfotransferase family protein [Gammaproteobacteria bacterium]|nr:sulfotransferase family protein [Gammaproteobacteria bacterium]MBU1506806.1 sulfotransferase family protein [Gammaproteobacteria bacterium]MBU2121993.1 sulfotransferase family protein [Gammaproteobacteria bacterium]MBU2277147.1 sulfotransferase family protein [Gammaproteobacteria bacterium]MBU2356230.1 sulfotransferase family protein [Gammaproteobacteria bacterium]